MRNLRVTAALASRTPARLATDVEEALAGLEIRELTVIGVSMGAAIALELLARTRMSIRAVALARPAWHWQLRPANLAVFPWITELLRDKGADGGRTAFQPAATRARERVDRLIAIPASAPKHPDRPGVLVLVVASTLDPVHPVATAEALTDDLDADLRLLAPRYEHPDLHTIELHRELQRFVERA